MFKVRALLCLVIAVLAAIGLWVWNQPSDYFGSGRDGMLFRGILLGVDALLFFSAVATLALTSLRVTRAEDGKLKFSGTTGWLWEVWFAENFKGKTSVSLCLTYWNVVFGFLMVVFVITIAGFLVYALGDGIVDFYHGNTVLNNITSDNIHEKMPGLVLTGLLVGLFATGIVGGITESRLVLAACLAFIISLALFAELMCTWEALDNGSSLPWALLTLPLGFLGVLAFFAVAVGIIFCIVTGLCKVCEALGDTAFGRMLMAAKNSACPVFELPPPPPSPPEPDPANPPELPQTT